MTKTFEEGRDEVARLCRYFATNRQAFAAPGVKEAHVRQSLIDPLFEALGWDVANRAMVAPQYREVILEDSLDVEGQQKAPDYTFRVGPLRKFYSEAKRCGVNIQADPAPAYQLRRYGWSAKVSVSILTSFEALSVYDCTLRPRERDKASRGRILYFQYNEYVDRWRELWNIFSRESVWSGAFDQYAASKRKRGTSEVDAEFLNEIERWRDMLARNIALRNQRLASDDLNAAVQLTIDRIVFLRMAEDRGLEPEQQLLALCERPDIYRRFIRDLCRRADEKYNSGLFHFQKEVGVAEPPDRLTPELEVDDRIFRSILQSLYFAHGSPYHFGVMPVEILGTVYERFLGKVIRLTAGHQAKVEEKPQVAKAGGVYYTPAYIVDYVVRETVAQQIAGRSPAQLAGLRNGKQSLRVLDMACGSGSFLLGAYQCLLDHCLAWYIANNPARNGKAVYKDPRTGEWRLTIGEKKRVLTTHLFGVDIDPQAVEVSKLSLLLRALEGENDKTLSLQLRLFHDRALPNLAENFKCGNSLIDPDYFTSRCLPSDDELKRVNPFDWKAAFPDAIEKGGFDCIIGNPPYIRIQTMKEWAPLEVETYKELFQSGRGGNYDIYVIFIEQGLKLLNSHGTLGYICPHKFFNSQYGTPLRAMIAAGRHLSHVVHFGAEQVFERATTYTCLLFLSKSPVAKCRFAKVDDLIAWRAAGRAVSGDLSCKTITSDEWNFSVGAGASLVSKLSASPLRLGDVADIFVGLQTSADDVFLLDFVAETERTYRLHSRALERDCVFEKALLRPVVSGTDVRRYQPLPNRQYILFPYKVENERAALIDFKTIEREQPKTAAYLLENRQRLEQRERGAFRGGRWHRFGRNQNLGIQQRAKICVPRLVEQLHAAFDHDGSHFLDNVDVGGITLKAEFAGQGLHYLLALLNSRLMRWYFPQISAPFRGGWRSANRQFLSRLPLQWLPEANDDDCAIARRLDSLVASLRDLHRRLAAADDENQRRMVERQIEAADAEIDAILYRLYGLSEQEITVVEAATR